MQTIVHRRLPHLGALVLAVGLCAALLSALAAPASAQPSLAGLWGSPFYRVRLTVAGSTITGTFASLADPSAPAGAITGQLRGDGRGVTATWTQPIGTDTGTFNTSLRLSTDGTVLNGYRWTEGGQPSAFALHRAVGGQVPTPLGPDDVATDASTTRISPETTVTPTSRPHSTRSSGTAYTLDRQTASALLAREYDREHFIVRLRLTWTQPGSILDTVGINAATVGSFSVNVDAHGNITLQVYAPARASATRNASGWHVLASPIHTSPGEPVDLAVTRTPEEWSLSVSAGDGPRRSIVLALPVPASGDAIYLGDFPGDNNWAPSYRPVRGFTGTAELTSFLGRIR